MSEIAKPAFIETPESDGDLGDTLKPAVQFYYTPETVEDFFQLHDLYHLLARGVVFIHNRKDSADYLIRTAIKVARDNYHFRFFQTHTIGAGDILEEITRSTNNSDVPEICVVDITSIAEDFGQFCETVTKLNRVRGVWLRGYICDINPRLIQLFDLLLVFDMSDSELDVLRTTISISSEQVDRLRDYAHRASNVDVVLAFLNYERLKDAPRLAYNPITLSQIKEDRGLMDISPFIPVIVEATKFIFNEVGKWISDVRQRASQESSLPVGSSLPMTKDQFVVAETDPKSISELLNQAATIADIDEIRNLVEQIKTRRALFLELESQEVTAAGAEAAKLRVQMQSTARDIIKTTERLEAALLRVYRPK